MASLQRPKYRFKLVEDGARFYIEVCYSHFTARVRVYKSFNKTYEAVRNCLRRSMNCRVGEELRHHLKSFLKSKRLPKRVGATISMQEKVLANELRRLRVPFRQQVPIAGYLVDFLVGEKIVIEVEGIQHYLNPEREVQRLKKIERAGYEVHRVNSCEVSKNPAAIAEYVREVFLRRVGQDGLSAH
jgi:very-short-patch-repair endonuclease